MDVHPTRRVHLIRGSIGAASHVLAIAVLYLTNYLIESRTIDWQPSGHGVTDVIFIMAGAECVVVVLLLVAGIIGAARTSDGWFMGDLALGWLAGLVLGPILICCASLLLP